MGADRTQKRTQDRRSGLSILDKPLILLASRAGLEPATPGLGNLCSILLSYRDLEPARAETVWTNAPRAGKSVSMDFRVAHAPRRRRRPLRAAAVFAAAALALTAPAYAACGTADGTVKVVDVDERLDLVLGDGLTVRLIGVSTPDPTRAPDLAVKVRAFLSEKFVGREGELERLAGGTDRWGRVAADLSFVDPASATRESAAAALLAAGFARVAPAFEPRGCATQRLVVEDAARRAGLGLWSDPRYAVIAATDLSALKRSDGRLVVIEGKIARVGFGRSRLYLDMVPKGGPTIVVSRKLEMAFARAGVSVDAAAGETVRVRGALDNRFGPRLEVSEPAMIEFLSSSDAPGGVKARP